MWCNRCTLKGNRLHHTVHYGLKAIVRGHHGVCAQYKHKQCAYVIPLRKLFAMAGLSCTGQPRVWEYVEPSII